ncbi:hypothetical protein HXP44_32885 [Streptomyces sioyaensis]|nr:hypothetical protein [Streptomyces sioyaensis]MBM4796693.1 hypothetical protein [Streptomyces sioyaensis]
MALTTLGGRCRGSHERGGIPSWARIPPWARLPRHRLDAVAEIGGRAGR